MDCNKLEYPYSFTPRLFPFHRQTKPMFPCRQSPLPSSLRLPCSQTLTAFENNRNCRASKEMQGHLWEIPPGKLAISGYTSTRKGRTAQLTSGRPFMYSEAGAKV